MTIIVEQIPPAPAFPTFVVLVGPTGKPWAWDQQDGQPAHADFIIVSVEGMDMENRPLFASAHVEDFGLTLDIARTSWDAWGTVRWDGRFEFYANLDYCDIDYLPAWLDAITFGTKTAAHMTGADEL